MFADQRGHAPCGLAGDAKLSLQFLAADAVLRRDEQEDRIEPELQRSAALFEDRPDHRVNVVAAPLAGECLLGLEAIPFRSPFTLGALVTLTEARIEEMLKASFIIGDLLEELANGYLFYTEDMKIPLTYGKGIHTKTLSFQNEHGGW